MSALLGFTGLSLSSGSFPCISGNVSLFFRSPPLHVCWGLKPQCLPLEDRECHAVLVTRTSFNLTHVFQDPGDYCFIFRAENAISKAHQYHRIQVWPSSK